jgi:hypothetical protein
MVTLLPIEPRNEQHGMLIVEAFSKLFINGGGQPDGWGYGTGDGYGYNGGDGSGYGDGWGSKPPEEWRVPP